MVKKDVDTSFVLFAESLKKRVAQMPKKGSVNVHVEISNLVGSF